MRIMHMMLSCFYIEGFNYQENALPKQNKLDGHDVRIVASTETFVDNMKLGYVQPMAYINEDGIPVSRISYARWLPKVLMKKVRAYIGVRKILENYKPDIIFFHGLAALELLTVSKFKQRHPKTVLFVDSHEDFHNSGRNFLSRYILHRLFYRSIISLAMKYIDKVLCISTETMDFVRDNYGMTDSSLELFPLGGSVMDEVKRKQIREFIRDSHGVTNDSIVIMHSGKLDARKKTIELLEAFAQINDPRLRLWLVGSIDETIENDVKQLAEKDRRISLLGWKSARELGDYLVACDLYAQPGTQSATLQAALCAAAPIMVFPYSSHQEYVDNNGFYVSSQAEMVEVFKKILDNPSMLLSMSKNSREIALRLLDYRKLANRMYQIYADII